MFSAWDLAKLAVTLACGVMVTISPYLSVAVTPASMPTFDVDRALDLVLQLRISQ